MAGVMTAFTLITGFVGRQYHVPLANNQVHQFGQNKAEESCQHACALASKVACCYYGARKVDTFDDAQKERANRVAWEMEGEIAKFGAGNPVLGFTHVPAAGADWKIAVVQAVAGPPAVGAHLVVTAGGNAAVNIPLVDLPHVTRDVDEFFALVKLQGTKLQIFDVDGNLIRTFTVDAHKIEDLKPVAPLAAVTAPAQVAFVKSWVCGLFNKNVNLKALKFHSSLGMGKLATCGAPTDDITPATESSIPVAVAKNKVLAGFAGDWDADLDVTRSGGVSLASILCAVFASVSLVLLVLLAKKKSHVEVPLVDDE